MVTRANDNVKARYKITLSDLAHGSLLLALSTNLECVRSRHSGRSVSTHFAANQVIERRRILDTGVEGLEVPQIAKGAQGRFGAVGDNLASAVFTKLLDICRVDPGGDDPSGEAAASTVEGICVALSIRGSLRVGEVVRPGSERWGHMVVETTGFVKGDDEESVFPLWTSTDGIVQLLQENLAIRDETGWVHGGGPDTAAARVDEGEFRKTSQVSILEEALQGLDVG